MDWFLEWAPNHMIGVEDNYSDYKIGKPRIHLIYLRGKLVPLGKGKGKGMGRLFYPAQCTMQG